MRQVACNGNAIVLLLFICMNVQANTQHVYAMLSLQAVFGGKSSFFSPFFPFGREGLGRVDIESEDVEKKRTGEH